MQPKNDINQSILFVTIKHTVWFYHFKSTLLKTKMHGKKIINYKYSDAPWLAYNYW